MRWGPVERELRSAGTPLLAGVDEVGRGPLAQTANIFLGEIQVANAIAGIGVQRRLADGLRQARARRSGGPATPQRNQKEGQNMPVHNYQSTANTPAGRIGHRSKARNIG